MSVPADLDATSASLPALQELNAAALRQWPLPSPSEDADKDARGRVLLVGGSREMPGAVILAGNAALRAGAGKLTIAIGHSVAMLVAQAIPEARVVGLPENPDGSIAADAIAILIPLCARIQSVLIGPGMQDEDATCALTRALLPHLSQASIVLDAYAMSVVRWLDLTRVSAPHAEASDQEANDRAFAADAAEADSAGVDDVIISDGCFSAAYAERVALTPHAGEMAHLWGVDKGAIADTAPVRAQLAATRWNAIVALKGATTHLAAPDQDLWRHQGGNSGLAISGSGDTLAGVIAGLAARGTPLWQACAWGIVLHAQAGEALARRIGPLGYLAREIADEIPQLLHKFGRSE